MKMKILLTISTLLILGLGIVVYALNSSSDSSELVMGCCKTDSCPMKNRGATSDASIHEHCDKCKGGTESCPMKKKGEASADPMKMKSEHSCPMMKGEGDHKMGSEAKHEMIADGSESCPMKKGDNDHKGSAGMKHDAAHKDGSHKKGMEMNHDMKADGHGHSCSCCSHSENKKGTDGI